MPLARLRAALPAAALSLLLLTGCTATDDGVTPASDADTSASVSTMPITSTPSVDAAATSRAAASSLAASSAAQSSRAAASSSSGAAESRAAEGSRSAGPAAPAAPAEPGSGVSPTGETVTAPAQSTEPSTTEPGTEQTPMEAPETPSVTETEGETPAEQPAAPEAQAPAAEEPAAEAPAAEGAAPAESQDADEEAGGQPVDAVQVTEGDEAAAPAETTGVVVAEEGHDDIEGQAEEEGDHGAAHIEDMAFSFEGPFGKFDQFQLQRGLQVYTEVCAACHGMKFVPIRTLHDEGGPGLPEDQVRAYAAQLSVVDAETGEERPRVPTDHFPTITGEGMGPDLSLMAKARAGFHGPYGTGINQLLNGIGGPEYIHALLTSYTGEEVEQAGSVFYENTAFASGLIAMPPPLSDDLVTYEDGTPATVDQMASDVAAFLMWTAEPKLTDRKQVGLVSVLFLIALTSLLYLTNKRIWAPHKAKKLHR